MNFHDSQTREQMEREGWAICNTILNTVPVRCYIKAFVEVFPSGIRVCGSAYVPMKSFPASLKAANAILEGVEG